MTPTRRCSRTAGRGAKTAAAGSSAAYEEGAERLAAAVAHAVAGESEWDARVAAGLGAGLELLAADPPLARVLLVEAPAAGSDVRLEHERRLVELGEVLLPSADPRSPGVMGELLARGLVSYLSGRVLAGEVEQLADAHEFLMEYLLAFRDRYTF
jgi:hypothetical protein